ncbi:MAG: hypothetical protein RL681_871 [Candidatus Parcubacteria bacterium]|jgi:hypothetical protein
MTKLFRVLAVIALACASLSLAGCGAVGDFIATEAYDIALTNTDRQARWEVVLVGGHHDPYTYNLAPGQITDDTVHVQSRWNSYGYAPTNNQYRYADVRVSAKNLSTGQAYGPVPAQLHWPGVTGIRVGGNSPPAVQTTGPDGNVSILSLEPAGAASLPENPNGQLLGPPEDPNGPGLPPAEDPNQGGIH